MSKPIGFPSLQLKKRDMVIYEKAELSLEWRGSANNGENNRSQYSKVDASRRASKIHKYEANRKLSQVVSNSWLLQI